MSYSVFVITRGAHTWNIYTDVNAHFIPAIHQSLCTCTLEPGLSRSVGIQFVSFPYVQKPPVIAVHESYIETLQSQDKFSVFGK
jgi:hypothetical protein